MRNVEVVARYKRIDANPFSPRFPRGDLGRIVGQADSEMSDEQILESAKKATPRGYEFIEVIREGKSIRYSEKPLE